MGIENEEKVETRYNRIKKAYLEKKRERKGTKKQWDKKKGTKHIKRN